MSRWMRWPKDLAVEQEVIEPDATWRVTKARTSLRFLVIKISRLTKSEKAIVNQDAIALMRANADKGYAALNGSFSLPITHG